MSHVCSESNGWPSHQRGRTFGFVPRQPDTFRRQAATHAAGSNTVITSAGASCAMKTNSDGSQTLPTRCQRFGGELLRTCGCLVCRAKRVSKCQDLSGQDLFQYVSDEGEVRDITSQDVNDYLREITNENFTAKDFRTWAGTILATIALNAQGEFETKKQAKANVKTAICAVAELLRNTPAICRKCYVHPAIVEAYLSGRQVAGLRDTIKNPDKTKLRAVESAVVTFLCAQRSNT